MPREKQRDKDLPPRYYRKHSSIYFVHRNKWTLVGKTAPDAWRHHLRQINGPGGSGKPETVDALLDLYALEIVPQKARETQRSASREIRWLLKAFGGVRLCDIEPSDAAAYIRERRAPTRATREIALLSHALSWSVEQNWLEHNPFIRAPKSITKSSARKSAARVAADSGKPLHRPIDPEAYFAFMCRGHALAVAAAEISGLTGLRKPDILNIRKEYLLEDGLYSIVSKSAQYRSSHPPIEVFFLWTPALRAAVAAALDVRSDAESDFLLHTRAGGRLSLSGFDQLWQDSMHGYADRFTFHSVRNSVGAFLSQTSGLAAVQSQLTHSSARTSHLYSGAVRVLPALDNCVLDNLRSIRRTRLAATPGSLLTA